MIPSRNWNYFCVLLLMQLLYSATYAGIALPLNFQKFPLYADTAAESSTSTGTISSSLAHRFEGYIEYRPNGEVVLRSSSFGNATTDLQDLVLFKTILKTIKLAPPSPPSTNFNTKIYGEGVEHKFPPFLERIIQRIQSYFSVYRYTDTSQPGPVSVGVPVSAISSSSSTSNNQQQQQQQHNYLTTTTTIITDDHMNLLNDLESTTFIDVDAVTTDADTVYGAAGGNDDYPEFVELKTQATKTEKIL